MPPRKPTDQLKAASRIKVDAQKKVDFLFVCIRETKDFSPDWLAVGKFFKMEAKDAEKRLGNWKKGFRVETAEARFNAPESKAGLKTMEIAQPKKAKKTRKPSPKDDEEGGSDVSADADGAKKKKSEKAKGKKQGKEAKKAGDESEEDPDQKTGEESEVVEEEVQATMEVEEESDVPDVEIEG